MDAEKRQYTLLALPTHLREAGDWSRLNRLLTSFRFLQQKTTVLAMLDHCFLAAMVAHAVERGAGETVQAASFPSLWQKCDGSWILPISQQPTYFGPNTGSAGRTGDDTTKPSPATSTINAARTPIG